MPPDVLTLQYIPLDTVMGWEKNAKLHDDEGIQSSIAKHGFKDPPKYEPHMNGDGIGGIVEGNGRIENLCAMRDRGDMIPRGIGTVLATDGHAILDWAIPVLFGVDADSQTTAIAYGVDHNNLTLGGGRLPIVREKSRVYVGGR
jgi:hypothetical protein